MLSRLYTDVVLSLALSGVVLANPIAGLLPRQTYSGTATYYFQNGKPGACGQYHSDQDHIVAIQTGVYANGAHCGQTITITDTKTGITATGVVADQCPSCSDAGSIDLSAGLFDLFASRSDGTFPVSWHF